MPRRAGEAEREGGYPGGLGLQRVRRLKQLCLLVKAHV